MKKVISFITVLCLFMSVVIVSEANTIITPSDSPNNVYEVDRSDSVILFNNGNEMIVLEDGSYVINDYAHDISSPPMLEPEARSMWIAIGKAIFKVATGVISTCSSTIYVTGHDVCRIVLNYVGVSKPLGNVYYHVEGRYIAGQFLVVNRNILDHVMLVITNILSSVNI